MQSMIYRRSLASRGYSSRLSALTPRAQRVTPRRPFADDVGRGPSPASAKPSRSPVIVGGALALCVPLYYIMHSDKPAGSGQAERKEARREMGTSEEFRDPRDSGVKTLEQKKAKEGR